MEHSPLISTVVVGIVLAFIFGAVANRLRISPLVGYLAAGVAVGPHTPGFVADLDLAQDLADIGVILLMFGVGLQFSPRELFSVKAIAIPGAAFQIALATLAGTGLGLAMGWPVEAGVALGLSLSIASTVVVIRELDQRRLLGSEIGRISVGWLIVEDLLMIFAIVALPVIVATRADTADSVATSVLAALGLTLVKTAAFIAVMLVVGQRLVPLVLHYIAHTGSRELFRMGVFALALGVAYVASEFVGASFALGAFIAGLVLSESELSQRAAAEALPLRDAFAVLFFVSVGMLFDPAIFLDAPWAVVAVVLVIAAVKPTAALAALRTFGYAQPTALLFAASRTQIGEFSFILAGLAAGLGVLPEAGRDLVLAGAILSIVATPALMIVAERIAARQTAASLSPDQTDEPESPGRATAPQRDIPSTRLAGHTVIVGSGRVGGVICDALENHVDPILVIEERPELVEALRARGLEAIHGHGPAADVMAAANLAQAKRVFVAIPNAFEAGQIVEQARTVNAEIRIIARAHSEAEADYLTRCGADVTILGERELANAMLAQAFDRHPDPKPAASRSASPNDEIA